MVLNIKNSGLYNNTKKIFLGIVGSLNDNNIDCCKTLKHNHPDANVVCGSMEKTRQSGKTQISHHTFHMER